MSYLPKLLSMTVFALALGQPAHAYYSTLDNGNMLKPGHYRMLGEVQFVTEGDSGMNLSARLDGAINEEMGWRGQFGFGTTDFFGGGFVKWVPIPDIDRQPAVGLLGGVLYARHSRVDQLSLRVHPFISKAFVVEFGEFTPYAALPFGLRNTEDDTELTIQLALGSEFKPNAWKHIGLFAEIAFDVREAFPYFSLAASLEWDEENGIQFE